MLHIDRVSERKSKKARRKKITDPDPGFLALIAFLLWLVVPGMTQEKAARIARASEYYVSVVSGSSAVTLDDYAAGKISFREVVRRYQVNNGNGEKLLASMGPQRVADWLNTITMLSSAGEL